MKTPDIKLNTPVKSSAMPHPSRRGFTAMNHTIATLATAISLSMSLTGYSATVASGAITDPAGDASQDDLVSASISIDDLSNVTFEAHFRLSSFLAGSSEAIFCLDLDRNPATGFSGLDGNHSDAALIGLDAQVNVPFDLNPYAKVYYNITGSSFPLRPAQYSFTTLTDGYQLTLPLADLGTTNTQMNFKAISTRAISPNSSNGVRDYMTNIGSPVGVVANVPEPSSALLLLSGAALCLHRRSLRTNKRNA